MTMQAALVSLMLHKTLKKAIKIFYTKLFIYKSLFSYSRFHTMHNLHIKNVFWKKNNIIKIKFKKMRWHYHGIVKRLYEAELCNFFFITGVENRFLEHSVNCNVLRHGRNRWKGSRLTS